MAHERTAAASFIGSFPDDGGPGHGLIALRGDIDAATVDRLGVHIDELLAAGTRTLMIEMSGAYSCDAALLDLLGHTQHRLGLRRGLLRVRGLHPSLLPSPDTGAERASSAVEPAEPADTTTVDVPARGSGDRAIAGAT